MQTTDKFPGRLTLIAVIFALINCVFQGFSGASILLLFVFTLSVFCCAKLMVSMQKLADVAPLETASLRFFLTVLGLIFVAIATFSYSYLFGVYFALIAALYVISPQDRDWLSGRTRIVMHDNRVEYRAV
ncbi:hypothetical protein [Allohahella sp. A8]|uniref:hypothetical protein n=1 Tax=Allohahella sp. A8 TaxID=3141461 RepID=UPI000C0B2AD8|nr:hypothetical protein [Hahellaceae bacterium]|tara:strand:- start:26069 stop:26458 length:390 start_codon:yes stop_codon:yes gene_type:complete